MRDVKVISFNSFSLSSLIDLKPKFAYSAFAGALNALLGPIHMEWASPPEWATLLRWDVSQLSFI